MDLRTLRQNKKLTIKELSEAMFLSTKRIKVIERGLDTPSLTEQQQISKYFEINIKGTENKKDSIIAGEGYTTAKGSQRRVVCPIENSFANKLKVLDLFCGVGGLSYGFEQAGHFETIAGVDLLSDRIDTFASNHPHAYGFCSDINDLAPKEVFDYIKCRPDVIVGGAPCQGFSSIRPFRNLNDNDQRNNLFKTFGLYVDFFKPDWFVFENVVGLLTHKGGETLHMLLKEFKSLGYAVDFKVINAAHFGVPQLRERLIIVGNRVGKEYIWPEPTHFYDHKSMAGVNNTNCLVAKSSDGLLPAVTIMDALNDLPILKSGGKSEKYLQSSELSDYQKYLREGSDKLTLHEATVHSEKMMEIIRHSGYNIDAVKHLVTSGFSTCYSRLEPNKPSVTLTVNFVNPSSNKCIHPIQDRALTPREGARIQGFPDKFIFCGSRTQIVKQIGNAVPPILSRFIAGQIYNNYYKNLE
ncbi:MAG: DNA (cytosine-5-)-methyltransferase [Rikenellaceae bacterium]